MLTSLNSCEVVRCGHELDIAALISVIVMQLLLQFAKIYKELTGLSVPAAGA